MSDLRRQKEKSDRQLILLLLLLSVLILALAGDQIVFWIGNFIQKGFPGGLYVE